MGWFANLLEYKIKFELCLLRSYYKFRYGKEEGLFLNSKFVRNYAASPSGIKTLIIENALGSIFFIIWLYILFFG